MPNTGGFLLVRQRVAAGGVMVTASHNPYQWNGIKYKASYGSSALPSIVAQIEKELQFVCVRSNSPAAAASRADSLCLIRASLTWTRSKNWSIGNASASRSSVLCSMPCTDRRPACFRSCSAAMESNADEIRGIRDPRFGGTHPEPIEPHIAPLQQAVRRENTTLGFAADGDGDRIGAVDRSGAFVNPHQIFSLLVWHLAGTRNLPGDIAKTFSVTKLVDKLAAQAWAQAARSSDRIQVHLRIDAGAKYSDWRRGKRWNWNQSVFAGDETPRCPRCFWRN